MQDLLKEYDNPSSIRISPLGNFRVVSDLIVDWEPSIENLRKIRPAMVAKNEFSAEKGCKQSQEEFDRISKQWDCILCGSCASECNKLEADSSDYMEPFVFTHAWRAAADSRGKDPMLHVKPSVMNEIYLALRSEGVIGSMGKTDIAFKLMRAGKMNPMHVFGEDEIEGHKDLVKMIKAAQEAAVKE